MKRARVDRRSAGVGVGRSEHRRSRASLDKRARTSDGRIAEVGALGDGVAAVDNERSVVRYRAHGRERPGRAAAAELQRAGGDRRRAGVEVGS